MLAPSPYVTRPRSATALAAGPPLACPLGAVAGLVAGVVVAAATWLLAGGSPAVAAALTLVAVMAVGALTSPLGAVVAAACCWGVVDGFVLNSFGELGAGPDDLGLLAVAAAAAAVFSGAAFVVRRTTG